MPQSIEELDKNYESHSLSQNDIFMESSSQSAETIQDKACLYALKKRLIVPRWWVVSVLLSFGVQRPWYRFLLKEFNNSNVIMNRKFKFRDVFFLLSIFHDVSLKASKQDSKIYVSLKKLLHGTACDIEKKTLELKDYFSSSFSISKVNLDKKNLVKQCRVSLFDYVRVDKDSKENYLELIPSAYFKKLLGSQAFDENLVIESSNESFISINPNMILSLSKRMCSKTVLNYFLFELLKQRSSLEGLKSWKAFQCASRDFPALHKEMLSLASKFYEHGLFGWSFSIPNIKISDVNKHMASSSNENSMGPVCLWNLSYQSEKAYELEKEISLRHSSVEERFQKKSFSNHNVEPKKALPRNLSSSSGTLFPEPPKDELFEKKKVIFKNLISSQDKIDSRIQNNLNELTCELKTETQDRAPKSTFIEDNESVSSLFDDGYKNSSSLNTRSSSKNVNKNEFIILFSDFYESLNPIQKKTLEQERARMSPKKFKSYMLSILRRRKIQAN